MQLRKVELVGFKSFADRTDLTFDGGITAIVGPNGCGKSNVVDAIRWVLGEQSAKSLRAGAMGDCIFAGTTSRKPLGFAEVSLVFDNSSGALPIEYDEVAVTRRVYGSGEGECFINRKGCRLRDIKELFMGTGVGTTAYSVIEQGEITRIVSSDPKELRAVFDEAAGICLYKSRLRTANAKLDRVSQNLLRVADILGEVEKRLRSVQYQAAKARRYRNLTARLKDLKLDRARRNFADLACRRAELAETLGRKRAEVNKLDESLRAFEAAGEAANAASADLAAEVEELSGRLGRLDTEAADLRQRSALCRERIGRYEKDEVRLAATILGRHKDLEAFQTRAVELELRTAKVARRTDGLAQLAGRASDEDRAFAEDERALSAEIALDENNAVEAIRAVAKLNNRLSEISASERLAERQKQRLASRRRELDSQRRSLDDRRGRLCKEKLTLEDEARRRREERSSVARSHAACEETRNQLDSLLASASERLAALGSRRELLEDLQRRRDGISDATRNILDMRLPGTRGLVAELVEVPADLAVAVEGLLGEDAGAVVMDSTRAAVEALCTLSAQKRGRAKIISLERAATHAPPARRFDIAGLERIAARVATADGCAVLADALLGDAALADTLETAISANGGTVGMRIATGCGEVVTPDGGITAGSAGQAGGLIWRKAEIERLSEKENRIRHETANLRARREELNADMARLAVRESDLAAAVAELETEVLKVSSEIARLDERVAEFAREDSVLVSEMEGLREELENGGSERSAVSEKIERSRVEGERLQERIADLKRRREEKTARRERGRARVTRLKIKLASALEKQSSLERQLAEGREALEEKAGVLQEALDERRAARDAIAGENEELNAARVRLATTCREANAARVVLAARRRSSEALKQEAARLAPAIRETRSRLDEAREEFSRLSIEEREVSVRLAETINRARDEMGATEDDLRQPTPSVEEQAAVDAEIEDTARKLSSIGSVNFEALEELDELEQRRSFLSGQRDDLLAAKDSLENIIAKTRTTSRKMFLESFESVKEHFSATFRRLFGGGRADCILMDPNDVLESPIRIMAKPPGKESSNLNLLSGGEKAMTAVALLFAMFATRPSPFLVLDEVDAPLDESNIGRFVELMRDFLPTSQFVVITHNRRTMAAADTLYGITMEERGVSKRVSVSFREAARVAEEAAVPAV